MKTLNIECLKKTEYIILLGKNQCSMELLEELLTTFVQEVYELCLLSKERNKLYFTLQYTRLHLLTMQKLVERDKEVDSLITETIVFLETSIHWLLSSPNTDTVTIPQNSQIIWTGKVINFMEWIYGADSLKHFNNGNATIKELAEYLGNALGIEIRDPGGCYVDMRDRIGESRTTYIDSMREALLVRMAKDDEKKYKRNK